MAFIITKGATTWWPVKWNVPVDGGGVVEVGFEMRFKRIGIAEFQALLAEAQAGVDADFLTKVATDWRGITDDAGRAVPFDAEGRAAMLDVPFVPAAMGTAWQNFFAAVPETRLGNSAPSPDAGPAAAAETAVGAPPETPA
jgi:hypothetical protein